jgi:hypothetical protein
MTVISEYLKSVPGEHRDLIREIDALIREAAPDVSVSLKWNNPTYSSQRNACAIVAHKHSVNLQVWAGADLDDPKHLLVGKGKGMRHIRFEPGVPFDRSAVAAIIKQAAAVAR